MKRASKNKIIGLAILTGVAIMGDAMLLIILPLYWSEMGLTAVWQVGVLLSVNRFIRLPINPLAGLFYRHYSLRTGVWIAMLLALCSTFSYGFFNQFSLLFIMRILWGIAWSMLRLGGFLTIMQVTTKQNRGQSVGMYNGIWGIGSLIGMVAGGFLIGHVSIRFVTTLFTLIGCISLPFIPMLVPSSKGELNKNHDKQPMTWSSNKLVAMATSLVMGLIIFGIFASTLSPIIELNNQANLIIWSVSLSSAALASIVQAVRWGWDPFLAPFVGKRLDRIKHRAIFISSLLGIIALLFTIIAFVQHLPLLIIMLLVFQLAATIFVTTTDTIATDLAAKENSVKIMTIHTILVDIGAAMGPFLSYLILEFSTLPTVYLLSTVLLAGLAIVWLSSALRERKRMLKQGWKVSN